MAVAGDFVTALIGVGGAFIGASGAVGGQFVLSRHQIKQSREARIADEKDTLVSKVYAYTAGLDTLREHANQMSDIMAFYRPSIDEIRERYADYQSGWLRYYESRAVAMASVGPRVRRSMTVVHQALTDELAIFDGWYWYYSGTSGAHSRKEEFEAARLKTKDERARLYAICDELIDAKTYVEYANRLFDMSKTVEGCSLSELPSDSLQEVADGKV